MEKPASCTSPNFLFYLVCLTLPWTLRHTREISTTINLNKQDFLSRKEKSALSSASLYSRYFTCYVEQLARTNWQCFRYGSIKYLKERNKNWSTDWSRGAEENFLSSHKWLVIDQPWDKKERKKINSFRQIDRKTDWTARVFSAEETESLTVRESLRNRIRDEQICSKVLLSYHSIYFQRDR